MLKDLRTRIAFILALAILSGWSLYARGIVLGLDLQGGTHIALEIADPQNALTAAQREDAIDRNLTVIRTRIDELGVAEPSIQKVGDQRIVVELPGATREDQQRAKDVIQRSAFLQFQIVQPMATLTEALPRLDRAAAGAGVEPGLTAGPASADEAAPGLGLFQEAEGADSVVADSAAAAADPAASPVAAGGDQPISSRLMPGGAGDAAMLLVLNEDVPVLEQYLELPQVQQALPRGSVLRWGIDQSGEGADVRPLYLLQERPLITGDYLVDAQAQRDPQLGQPLVTFEFNRRGGRLFEQGTGENVNNFMAIVLDNEVVSAPVIRSTISNRGQIELAGGTIREASDLALVLRAGALPAPIEIVEERSIGPSLGQDSIDQGMVAGVVGSIAVILIMLVYYRTAGAMAVGALGLYVLFVLAALSSIGATLTLPGIAGFILSVGMAVDANVLIFERIREELAAGRSPRVAVSEGFKHALSAIVDSQVTTLLTAAVLFQFGTGPVRGFAVTLAIGILASMFTAIFVTRTFFMIYLDRRPTAQTVSI